jgi:hypothetical protein
VCFNHTLPKALSGEEGGSKAVSLYFQRKITSTKSQVIVYSWEIFSFFKSDLGNFHNWLMIAKTK